MGPELELEARSDGNKASGVRGNGGVSVDNKDDLMKCGNTCEGDALNMDKSIDQPMLADENQDVELKDSELPSAGGNEWVNADCQDSTESSSSSSFDDTACETEDATTTIDGEVGSNLFSHDSPVLDVNAFGDLLRLRKKKLTSHWRTFVHPLMWRCKWAELQVKKLRDLAMKYDRKLADYKRNSTSPGFNLKSVQFPGENPTDKVMKRKKRRRVEDTMDPAAYLSNHPVLSYFDNKNRTAGGFLDKDLGNQERIKGVDRSEVHGERLWLESSGGDTSLEELLRNIGLLQAQARDLNCRLGKVMTENSGLSSCTNDTGMTVPANLTISARFPASHPNNGDRMAVGSSKDPSQLTSVYTTGTIVMPKVAVPSHAEGSNQSQRGALMRANDLLCWPAEDDVLIYDERLRLGMKNFDDLSIPMEKPQVLKVEPESTFNKALSESELQTDVQQSLKISSISESELQADVQQPLKMRSISKITTTKKVKRKGRRKAGSSKQSCRKSK